MDPERARVDSILLPGTGQYVHRFHKETNFSFPFQHHPAHSGASEEEAAPAAPALP